MGNHSLATLHRFRVIGILAAILPALVSVSLAADSIIGYTTSGGFASIATTTWGIEFTTDVDIVVDALGMFDYESDGLFVAHDVGLWDLSGDLLASGTIPSGTAAPLIEGFRFVNVAPLALNAGTYRVGVSLFADVPSNAFRDAAMSNATLNPSPQISLTYGSFSPDMVTTTLTFPSVLADAAPSAAANFRFMSALQPGSGIEALIGDVADLVAIGALKDSHGMALTKKLDGALRQLEKGNTLAVVDKLQGFIDQLVGLAADGEVELALADELISDAQDIIDVLQSPSKSAVGVEASVENPTWSSVKGLYR